MASFIANDDQRRERQVLAALHNFGDAIDRNHLIFQIEALRRYSVFWLSHSILFSSTFLLTLCLLTLCLLTLCLLTLCLFSFLCSSCFRGFGDNGFFRARLFRFPSLV